MLEERVQRWVERANQLEAEPEGEVSVAVEVQRVKETGPSGMKCQLINGLMWKCQ